MRIQAQLHEYTLRQYEEAARSGTPVMRPLFYDFEDDPQAQAVDDQLLFGSQYI